MRPQINLQAPLRSPPSALIGFRPAIARLHIVYRLSRCVARSLRSLAIRRSSRSSQAPQGHRVVPSLPLLDHRHYGGGLLRAAAWLITDAGLPAVRVCRVVAGGPLPPAGCGRMSATACPLTRAGLRSCALYGRCPRSARANTSPHGLRPPLRYGRKIERRPQGPPSARPLGPAAPSPFRARLGALALPRTRQPPVGPSPAPDCFFFFASLLRRACLRAQSAHPLVKDI